MDKATRAQVKEHNRRLVMRAIYQQIADSRASLAKATGLTKPTIGTIMNDLIDSGYVTEIGYGKTQRRGGKRPMLVKFMPKARQVMGISIAQDEIIGGIAYLDGEVVARHQISIPDDGDVMTLLIQTVNALYVQHDAPLLAMVIGVSGIVNQDKGIVTHSDELDWHNIPLAEEMQTHFDLPCYVSNNTELVTRLHATSAEAHQSQMVTVRVEHSLEIGSTFGDDVYQHGASISNLGLSDRDLSLSYLHWHHVQDTMQAIIDTTPDGVLADYGATYFALRHALHVNDKTVEPLVDNLSACLAYLYRWIIGLMRPSEIILVGTITDLGDDLLSRVTTYLQATSPDIDLSQITFTLDSTPYLSMKGAIIYGIQTEVGIL
ncbi:MAG: ROK family protein [Chloroflexota bacterium]